MKILKNTYQTLKQDKPFIFVVYIWLVFLIIFPLLKTVNGQSKDIHSFSISSKDQKILDFADSLLNCDYQKASHFIFNELDQSLTFDKPDIYTELLTKAISASYLSGQISLADSLYGLLLNVKFDNMHPVFESRILLNQAMAARTYRQFLLALDFSKKALLNFEQYNNKHGQLLAIGIIVRAYHDLGNYKEAVNYIPQIEHLLIYERDESIKISMLVYLSKLMTYVQNFKESQTYLDRANSLIERTHLSKHKASVHYYQAILYYQQKNYTKANKYFDQAIELKRKYGSLVSLSSTITFKAAIAMRQEKYKLAEIYNRQALEIRSKVKSRYLMGSSHFNIANSLIYQSRYDSALMHIQLGTALYSVYNTGENIRRGLELQKKVFIHQKDFKNAYNELESIIEIDDSLFEYKTKIKLDELESDIKSSSYKQEKIKLETATALQKSKNETNKLILQIGLILLFFSAILSFIIFNHIKETQRRKLLLLNQQMVFIQMNSHFVFNALTAIQSLLFKKQIESAIHFLTIFSNLVKKILFVTHRKYIDFQVELGFVMEYLQLQKLRFGDDLKFQLLIDDKIHKSKLLIPPLLIYPYIEYAVEECLQRAEEKSMLIIQADIVNDVFYYRLIDMGLGFSNTDQCYIKRFAKDKISCMGLTKERIALYNSFYRKKIQFKLDTAVYNNEIYPSISFKIKI